MLYRGSEVMREVGWVIFDEIHYMRDKERGVVWEETLILLPHNVHFVFLSATILNARQFAEWVAYLHQQPCHVVYTDYRPTPLEHYIYPAGAEGIHLLVDESGAFRENNFNNAMAILQNLGDNQKYSKKTKRHGTESDGSHSSIFKLVNMIMVNDLEPVIIFSFSKKDCEVFAMHMTKMDFNERAEKQLVDTVINNALSILSEEDRHLPQVESTLPLLRRGIGIHHGGLLPILKETTEILFGEGLIKVLFATETFAMGLNMPARTVLFTGIKKFDGHNHRWMTSGEYIQMTGRAGRRGRDKKGTAILMVDEKIRASVVRDLVQGLSDPLNSAFHLTYNMVLNHLRVEEINPEYMLERSFYQFQNEASIPGLHDDFCKTLEKYNSFKIDREDQIASYYDIKEALDVLLAEFRIYLTKPQYLVRFLQPGRLVKVKTDEWEYNWGVIANFKKVEETQETKAGVRQDASVQMDVLLHVIVDSTDKSMAPKPCMWQDLNCPCSEELQLVSLDSKFITEISSVRLPYADDVEFRDGRKKMYKSLKFVKDHFKGKPPLLKPIEDMKIQEPRFLEIVKKMETLENKLKKHPLCADPMLESELEKYAQKVVCDRELAVAKQKLTNAKSVLHLDELKNRKKVLRRLGYCTETDVIQLKGRVACELSSADEILLTEMIYDGLFGKLSSQQICALLSCLVCDERTNETQKLSEELSGPLRQMQDLARRIAKVSKESGLPLDEEIYVEQFKPYLMNVVFAWCSGSSFAELCKMTDIFEGSIIRCIRRLEELLRQMVQACKIIGNTDLEAMFDKSIILIKRDIIFSASLYL
ncbi:exosome RNA helicase MTR4-like isoform X2 [Cylas formicarius]|nr:exosome RNA helicase MTR4-like isoform X2 [Cylas formicarius]